MKLEIIATGKDVNEAIDSGCAQLGIERGDAEFEIIERQKKGFLGFGSHPAKVRIYMEVADAKPQPPKPSAPAPKSVTAQPKPATASEPAPAAKPAPKPVSAPVSTPAPAPAAKPETPAEKSEPATVSKNPAPAPETAAPAAPVTASAPTKAPRPERPRRERPERPARPERAPRPVKPVEEEPAEEPQQEIVPTDEVREKVEKSAAYVQQILSEMGFEAVEVTPKYYESNVCLQLEGNGLGVIIGRRGETLDAIQYLASLVANRGEGEYIRININSGHYREKREKTLSALARKLALQVVRTGRSITLEPMNPYERRVIHGAVSKIRGATSASVGTDPNRRVVISCTEPPRTKEFSGNKSGKMPRRGPRPPRKEFAPETVEKAAEVKSAPEEKPSEAAVAETAQRPEKERRDFKPRQPRRDSRPPRTGSRPPRRPMNSEEKPSSAPAEGVEKAQPVNDAELFADLPRGVPLISGVKAEKPASAPAQKKPEKATGSRYGKIDL